MRYKYAFTFVVFVLQSDREIFRVGLPTLVVGQRLDCHFFYEAGDPPGRGSFPAG